MSSKRLENIVGWDSAFWNQTMKCQGWRCRKQALHTLRVRGLCGKYFDGEIEWENEEKQGKRRENDSDFIIIFRSWGIFSVVEDNNGESLSEIRISRTWRKLVLSERTLTVGWIKTEFFKGLIFMDVVWLSVLNTCGSIEFHDLNKGFERRRMSDLVLVPSPKNMYSIIIGECRMILSAL